MNAALGTLELVRLALRRDRLILPSWLAVFLLMAVFSSSATGGLYPSVAARVEAANGLNDSPALVAMYGRIYDPTSLGALALLKMEGTGAVLLGVLAVVLVVRHTRGEEEAGRLELVGSGVVGRYAPLTAALVVVGLANLLLGLVTAAGLAATGLPTAGSLAFGLAWAGTGLVFAAVGAVVAQLAAGSRAAIALGIAVLAVVYVVRAVGDTAPPGGPTWAVWLSPIGWEQQVRPFEGERWWVLGLMLALAVLAGAAAFALAARRDLGAGLLPDRPGPASASAGLRSPLGLAWRLQRGLLAGWATGFVLLGGILGSVTTNVSSMVSSPQMTRLIQQLGGQKGLVDAFLATEMGLAGSIAAAYAVQASLRLRAEEETLRAEPVLATAVGRLRWVLSHVTVAVLGTTVLMVGYGLAVGTAYAAQSGDAGQVGRVLAAALVQLPATWVLAGIVVAAFGLVPRATAVGWGALVAFLLLGELGPLMNLDQHVMDVSPFAHVPKLPGGAFSVTPVVALTAVAAALVVAGLVGARRRDLG